MQPQRDQASGREEEHAGRVPEGVVRGSVTGCGPQAPECVPLALQAVGRTWSSL